MKNSSSKGSSFERAFCKELSLWVEPTRDDIFWRTSGSGARATTRAKQGKGTISSYGDVGAIDPIGVSFTNVFIFELKKGYTCGKNRPITRSIDICAPLDTPSTQKESLLVTWWDKLLEEALRIGRVPLLIFQRDRRLPVIVYPLSLNSNLREFVSPKINARWLSFPRLGITVYNWIDFKSWIDDPENLLLAGQKYLLGK